MKSSADSFVLIFCSEKMISVQSVVSGLLVHTLTPLLLDPFYEVQGKFLKIFRHKLRMDTNRHESGGPQRTTDGADNTDWEAERCRA